MPLAKRVSWVCSRRVCSWVARWVRPELGYPERIMSYLSSIICSVFLSFRGYGGVLTGMVKI